MSSGRIPDGFSKEVYQINLSDLRSGSESGHESATSGSRPPASGPFPPCSVLGTAIRRPTTTHADESARPARGYLDDSTRFRFGYDSSFGVYGASQAALSDLHFEEGT